MTRNESSTSSHLSAGLLGNPWFHSNLYPTREDVMTEVRELEFDEARREVRGVRLASHGVPERLEADLVLVGIGLLPNTELASAAGLSVDNGIVVDEYAQTEDPDSSPSVEASPAARPAMAMWTRHGSRSSPRPTRPRRP